jgi:two-component system, cell cycle sensor histidine kinase PleC
MLQNKYIIRLSFLALFLTIITNIVLYRYFMIKEMGIKEIGALNSRIVENYKNQVWESNPIGVEKFKKTSYLDLLQDPDFIKFAKDSIAFFANTGSQINLYDMYGNKVFTNQIYAIKKVDNYPDDGLYKIILNRIDNYFLRGAATGQSLLYKPFKGKTEHIIIPKTIISNNQNFESKASFIVSYIPIIDSKLDDFVVDGVMEIYTNITEQWQSIEYLSENVLITFLVIFSIFFVVIIYNTNYAQKIINQQFETNRDLEEAKTRAEKESSSKTEFLANISHELRTPLNAIIGFSEIMISEGYGPIQNNQYKEYVQDINNSGKHLLAVINDILDFSKASADKLKVDHIEIDLGKLALSSMRFIKPRADEAKIALIDDIPKEYIIIEADPKRLKQVFLNILSNAVKFTPENGSITLKITKDPENKLAYARITDTGIGMNEKDIPKALSTFGQVDNKLNRKYEGTGLGLPLTKKLVELMHGGFDIQSEFGKGTSVILSFSYKDSVEI